MLGEVLDAVLPAAVWPIASCGGNYFWTTQKSASRDTAPDMLLSFPSPPPHCPLPGTGKGEQGFEVTQRQVEWAVARDGAPDW